MLAGREAEIGELTAVLDSAAEGTSRAAAVSGPAGIGKSALVEELASRARDRGFDVHWARCVEIGGAPAYWPWTQLVRSLVVDGTQLSDELAVRDAVAVLAPDLVPALAAAAPVDSEENRFRLFDGVARFLDLTARRVPQLLVVEDCHVADIASLHLLRFLTLQSSGRGSWMITATHRPEGDPARTALLQEIDVAATHVSLDGIDASVVGELVAAQTGTCPSDDVVTALREATGGNPLFVNALVRHLSRNGSLDDFRDATTAPVPDGIRQLVMRRLGHLPAHTVRGLATLAAAGRDVEPLLARRILGDAADDVVDAGLSEGYLERGRGGVRFAHALMRRALLDSLPPGDRRRVHRTVGDAMESIGGAGLDRLAALAHHFAEAGADGSGRAFRYARAAGDHARRVGAFADASEHYETALATGVGDEKERSEVLVGLGDSLIRAGRLEEGRRVCRDAWDLARSAGLPRVMADAALAFSRFGEGGVVNEEVVRLVTGALAEIGDREPGLRSRLRGRLASELVHAAGDETREVLAREAAAEALGTGDPHVVWTTLRFAQSAMSMPDNLGTCVEWTTAAAAAADAIGDVTGKAEVIAYRSVHLLALGDAAGFGADVAAIAQIATSVPTPLTEWHVTVAAGCRAMLDGRFDDAAAHVDESLAFASTVPNALASWQFQDFSLAWERGDVARLEPILNALVQLRPGIAPMARAAILMTQAASGRRAEANAAVEELARDLAGRRMPWVWLLAVAWCAEAASTVGNRAAAQVLYQMMLPFRDLHVVGATGTVAAYWGSVRRYLANLALALGNTEEAVAHGEAALAAHARVGSVPFAARSQFELGRALLVRGGEDDKLRAESLIADARAIAERIGMAALLETVGPENVRPVDRAATPAAPSRPRLIREGEYWTLSHQGGIVRLRDAKGVHYLAALLREPGREIHALDLTGARTREGPTFDDAGGADVLDSRAKADYRRRLQDLEEEMAEADAAADIGRAALLRQEWEFLIEELKRATGIGGRSRSLGTPPAEAARIAATKAIRAVLKKVEAANPELGRHFRATVRTGTFCSYNSDIEPSLDWEVTTD